MAVLSEITAPTCAGIISRSASKMRRARQGLAERLPRHGDRHELRRHGSCGRPVLRGRQWRARRQHELRVYYPSWMIWDFAIIEAALQYCHAKERAARCGVWQREPACLPLSCIPIPAPSASAASNRHDVRKLNRDAVIESFWGASWGPDLDVVAPCLEIPTTDRFGGQRLYRRPITICVFIGPLQPLLMWRLWQA